MKQLNQKRKIEVDESKCRFCGLCYGLCPLEAIQITYYNLEELLERAKGLCAEAGARGLTVACKGSNPNHAIISRRIDNTKMPVLQVPCLGRVPLDFYVKLLADGAVKSLHILQCEEDFCRLKDGGQMSFLRVNYLRNLLSELEADGTVLNVIKGVNKAKVNESKCIGCGNCAHYCPYEAASIRSPGIASINEEKCMGCGICLAYCPNFSITLEGYEHENLNETLTKLSEKVKKIEAPIIVFYCQWACTPKTAEGSGSSLCFIELPCAGRADPLHIIQALNLGFEGVLVLACRQDMCNFEMAGAKRSEENIGALKRLLRHLGLERKVDIVFASPKYPVEADDAISSFMAKIRG